MTGGSVATLPHKQLIVLGGPYGRAAGFYNYSTGKKIMEFLVVLFFGVLGSVIKRFALPAIAIIAVVSGITFAAGGSWLVAAGISAGICVIGAIAVTVAALNKPW